MAGAVTVTVTNLTDARKVAKMTTGSEAFGLYAASEWYRLYYNWIPMDGGRLADNVTLAAFEITHYVPYAAYQYYGGDGRRTITNHSTDKHMLASVRWDDAAVPTQKEKLEAALTKYLDKEVVVD